MLVLILFSLLFIKTQSLSCTSQFHCNSVTTNHNYVSCVSGLCQCLTALGFDGNASVASQCRCDAPSSVYYQASTPYCFRYSDAAACKVEVAKQVYQKTVIEAVYEIFGLAYTCHNYGSLNTRSTKSNWIILCW